MNVIVICSDTFRYDHIELTGRQKVFTPNLNALARESASFQDFWLCSFPTVLNRIEVFTGRCTFPFMDWGPLPFHHPVLAEVLGHHGVTTALVADNPHMMKPAFGFGRGFDFVKRVPGQTDDSFLPESAPMIDLPCAEEKLDPRKRRLDRYRRNAEWYRQQGTNPTETVFREAMRWLEAPPERFFLWLDTFDPHEPWDAPRKYLEPYPWHPAGDTVLWPKYGKSSRYSESDIENMRSLYKAEVTQTDYWVGALMEYLRARKVLDNTVVIFCSDHGFYLGEHGLMGKLRLDRPTVIYEELGHVPLMIRHPAGHSAGRTISGLCQPLDLFATVLDLAGVPSVSWTHGQSLAPQLDGKELSRPFIVGGCHPRKDNVGCLTVTTAEWSFIYSPQDGLAGSELYARQTDPHQLKNVIETNRPVAERHFQMLVSWVDGFNLPASRREQLLHATGFGWFQDLKQRVRTWNDRRFYRNQYRDYTRRVGGH
jgi:arylsulfatase A-like enzyme